MGSGSIKSTPLLERFTPRQVFTALLGFFLLLRLLTLLTAVEWVSDWEELYRGTIAKELIEGLKMPLWDYQADVYSGGSLVVGLLAAPLFKILGPSLFALKLVPLFFAAAALSLLFYFFLRFFGFRAAVFAALFLIFCPPDFAQFSLVAMGYHSESVFFSVLILFLFYRLWYGSKNGWNAAFCGLACGLGIWFTNITGITVLTVLLAWIRIDRPGFFRGLPRFLVFFAAGMTPWLAYNTAHGWKGLEFVVAAFVRLYKNDVVGPTLELSPLKIARLLLRGIPLSYSFSDLGPIPGWFFCYLYYGAAVLSLVFLAVYRKKESVSKLPFYLYPAVYLFVYWISRVGVVYVTPDEPFYRFFEFRYFVPLQFFIFCLLAFSADASRAGRRAAVFLWALGLIGQAPLYFQEPFGRAFFYHGYSYASMGVTLEQSEPFPGSLRHFLKVVEKRRENAEKQSIARGFFGWGVVLPPEMHDAYRLADAVRGVPREYRPAVAEGLGLSCALEDSPDQKIGRALPGLLQRPERDFFYFGYSSGRPRPSDFIPADDQIFRKWFMMHAGREPRAAVPPKAGLDDLKWFYRGAGQGAAVYWIFRKGNFLKASKRAGFEVPESFAWEFDWGTGWEIARELGEDETRARGWLLRLPPGARAAAEKGFEAALQRFWPQKMKGPL